MITKLKSYKDQRGQLTPIEFENIPFEPARIFYVKNVPSGTIRGEHGHFKCKQYYICIAGIIEVKFSDDKTILLTPGNGIFIDNMTWTSEKFCVPDSVLLVLCSHEYDEADYYTEKIIYKK